MKIKTLLFLISIFTSIQVFSQRNNTEAALYNISLGSIGSGIGALINKKPNEKWDKVLIKGIWQGAIGGYLVYESKNLIGRMSKEENWAYSWGAKFVNSAGTSIIENASSNRDFWEVWHFNIGFNRIEFHTKNKFKIRYKVMPISLTLFVGVALESDFEFKRTLQTGELVFSKNNLQNQNAIGATIGNIPVIDYAYLNDYRLFAHEFIHIYQYYDYNFLNPYYSQPLDNLTKKLDFFNVINNIFYWDLQAPVLRGLYLLEGTNNNCYYDNFFEHEAEFYASGVFNCN